jgi:hypothetical protein
VSDSRLLSLKASDLDGLADGADPNYIEADNTELARRRAEARSCISRWKLASALLLASSVLSASM